MTSWALLVSFLGLGALLAVVCHARPAYDANGWMVWGEQTLHWNLNLNGAPSWKPLTYIFTLPYALTGHTAQMWLLTVTMCAGGVAAPLMAGRVAYRLAPRSAGWMPSWLPPLVAAAVACGITATMTVGAKGSPTTMGLLRQVLIDSSDPLVLALWLAAVDRHLSRRYRLVLAMLWLSALGRPEVWLFLGGYAVWLWLTAPALRIWAVLAILSMPVAWFLAPGLASNSWMSAGDFDLGQATALHGDKFTGVLDRVRTLSGTAVQIEVAAAIVIAALCRDRRSLALVALTGVWTLVEIVFALHGWSAVQRYLIEPGGLLAVIGGVGVARALTWPSWRLSGRVLPLNLLGAVGVVVFIVAVIPFARTSVNAGRGVIENQRLNQQELDALTRLVTKAGGAKQILACGAPDGALGWQSGLAWELGLSVGDVGYRPFSALRRPTVAFGHQDADWKLRLIDTRPTMRVRCAGLQGLSS